MSSVYESSYLSELDSIENFGVPDILKRGARSVSDSAKKVGSAVVKGANSVSSAAKSTFNWFGGWMKFFWVALIIMSLMWAYKNLF